jgi:hypothetical protein
MKNDKKKYATHYVFVILSTALLLSGNVYAQNGAAASKSTAATSAQQTKLSDRVLERKNLLKLQFSEAQTQQIGKNCVAAQALIKDIASNDKKAADKRRDTYANLSTRATTALRTLQDQGVNITELKAAQIQFDATINQYIADTSTYKDTIADSMEINCASDVIGFEATLTTARQLRMTMANDANQVRAARTVLSQNLAKMAETLNAGSEVRQ